MRCANVMLRATVLATVALLSTLSTVSAGMSGKSDYAKCSATAKARDPRAARGLGVIGIIVGCTKRVYDSDGHGALPEPQAASWPATEPVNYVSCYHPADRTLDLHPCR
ncbi:hypothetical protein AOQ71_31695 [Bradyrhizobium manausense]|uniref:Secreted protein n=1 Tax=Bradyrhizobium manausense TaxID=989370 RepID=A0A0R3D416_9BRAD|nr:hypothetical protein AOQ71_31695 [Bradyrhizobium manausense]